MKGGNNAKMAMGQEFQENNVEQKGDNAIMIAELQSIASKVLKDKLCGGYIYQELGNMNQDSGMDGSSLKKPKSTWTRINQMDFGLGGISKAFMLPTIGKRYSKSDIKEGKDEAHDTRVVKHGKVGNDGDNIDDISARVENHPYREQ